MKDLVDKVDKYDLGDFFAYIFPGAIILLSLLFWLEPKFDSPIWKQEFLIIFLLLLFSYILGLILASYNRIYNRIIYNRTYKRIYNQIVSRPSNKWLGWLLKIINKLLDLIFSFLSIKNSQKIERIVTESKIQISNNIDDISDQLPAKIESWMFSGLSSWEWLQMCRILLASYTVDRNKYEYILAETESLHRRFLFSMNISLALLLVALQVSLRLIIFVLSPFWYLFKQLHETLPNINIFFLVVIALISFWSSVEMRRIANNISNRELYLIACLKKE